MARWILVRMLSTQVAAADTAGTVSKLCLKGELVTLLPEIAEIFFELGHAEPADRKEEAAKAMAAAAPKKKAPRKKASKKKG